MTGLASILRSWRRDYSIATRLLFLHTLILFDGSKCLEALIMPSFFVLKAKFNCRSGCNTLVYHWDSPICILPACDDVLSVMRWVRAVWSSSSAQDMKGYLCLYITSRCSHRKKSILFAACLVYIIYVHLLLLSQPINMKAITFNYEYINW